MSIGSFFKNLWVSIGKLFGRLSGEARKALTVAFKVVEAIKNFVDSPAVDVITALIPGNADDILVKKLRVLLPQLLAMLAGLRPEDGADMSNDDRREVVLNIKNMHKGVRKMFTHGIASLITEGLTKETRDEIPWSEATVMQEYHKVKEAV